MSKILIIDVPEQCPYYGYECGDCNHPKAEKWAGCGGKISKGCPLPDASTEGSKLQTLKERSVEVT